VQWYRYLHSVWANGNGDQYANLYSDYHPRRSGNCNTNADPVRNSDINEHPWGSGYCNTDANSIGLAYEWWRGKLLLRSSEWCCYE
jgi:hypothetical protein